jgi:hypothetical protein
MSILPCSEYGVMQLVSGANDQSHSLVRDSAMTSGIVC